MKTADGRLPRKQSVCSGYNLGNDNLGASLRVGLGSSTCDRPERRTGWSIDVALGISLAIAIGGLLNGLRATSTGCLILFTLVGASLVAVRAVEWRGPVFCTAQHLLELLQGDRLMVGGTVLLGLLGIVAAQHQRTVCITVQSNRDTG